MAVNEHELRITEPSALKHPYCSFIFVGTGKRAGHNRVTDGSTNVVGVPHFLKDGAIVSTTHVRDADSLGFQLVLDVIELVGSRVGRHDTSRRQDVVCREMPESTDGGI